MVCVTDRENPERKRKDFKTFESFLTGWKRRRREKKE